VKFFERAFAYQDGPKHGSQSESAVANPMTAKIQGSMFG
jgi:hypothetical protein